MGELTWFALSLPRELSLAAVTAVLRPLADRPRYGLAAITPLVVFEVWSHGGEISWRLGVDSRISGLPARLGAHLPRLGIVAMPATGRPALTLAADLRLNTVASPLRLDTAGAVSAGLLDALSRLQTDEVACLQWLVGPSQQRRLPPTEFGLAESLGLRPPRKPDSTAKRLWAQKTSEPLFACRGRIGALATSPARAYGLVRDLAGALKLADTGQAGLRLSKATVGRARRLADAGASPWTWSCLLSAAELGAVLSWPLEAVNSEALPLVGGHVNPVPLALRLPEVMAADRSGERVLGESLHPAERGELVTMPAGAIGRHCHAIGPTGSGKSTLLASMTIADIAAGRGVLVVEPRGDLVNDILARIPAHRREDVVVIDPADGERSIGLNVLAGEQSHAERRADQLVSLLAELHGANFGPRTADIALHALITASRLPDGTICDVPILLTNAAFRRRALAQVSDPLVLGPWWAGFAALSDAERGQHVAPLLNKLRPFTSRDHLRRMLGQATPRFDIGDLFTKRRAVLINLNRGLLGDATANLLGALILTQAWSAAQRRASIPQERRHLVTMVFDEFQDYLHIPGVDFGDVLAQARGLGLGLTLAHQHLGQLTTKQRASVSANARSRVVFRPATDDAKPLAATFGSDVTGEDLLRLKAYEACCQLTVDGQPTVPFSVRTRPLPAWTSDPAELRRLSGERYGVDGAELDKALIERWHGASEPEGPIGVKRRRASS